MAIEKANYIEILDSSPPETQRIIKKVIKLEAEKLYQRSPRVTDDLINIIKEEVQ